MGTWARLCSATFTRAPHHNLFCARVRRCVFFCFFALQPRSEFALTRLPLSHKGNFNDTTHRSCVRVFTVTVLICSSAHQGALQRMHRYTSIYMRTDIHPYTVIPAAMSHRGIENEEHRPTAADRVEGLLEFQELAVRGGLRNCPPTVGGIFWTGKPKSSVRDTDRARLNCTDGPNTNRKRRPWIIIEELPGGWVRVMYVSSNSSEPIYLQRGLLRVIGHQQHKGRRVGRRLRRRISSSSSPFLQRLRMVGRC